MRRVVVTGMGIVSSIGNNTAEVLEGLRQGRCGIEQVPLYKELGFRSQVAGTINLDTGQVLDTRTRRFMGDAAAYTCVAMREAIADAGLSPDRVSDEMTGLIVGSGGSSSRAIVAAADTARQRGVKQVGPTQVPKAMSSTCSANLATQFAIKGVSYSISSACTTSAHCIGHGAELIQTGKQNVVFAGGGDELDWTLSVLFDAMGALSSAYNHQPDLASRAFDRRRDGFVISGGGGILVLESLEHAESRGAKIYAELVGYGVATDGAGMVAPTGEGAVRSMNMAMRGLSRPVDYINAHATSTPVGDLQELKAIRRVFPAQVPVISSTKSLTGHAQGAAGVHEAIYSLLMLNHGFICKSANFEAMDPELESMPGFADGMWIAREMIGQADIRCVLSNSFGFGGTNASLVFAKPA